MRAPSAPALALLLGLAACPPQKTAFQLGVPGVKTSFRVARAVPRGPVLDLRLEGPGLALRSFAPSTPECARVLAGAESVTWIPDGAHGTLERDGRRCTAVGIGSLEEWRRHRPQTGRSPVPSGRAEYREVYRDEEVVFLRGRFPLVGRVGFSSLGDAIAVVPNREVCAQPVAQGRSTIEYFPTGEKVLTLTGEAGRCPIVGLIRPEGLGDAGA